MKRTSRNNTASKSKKKAQKAFINPETQKLFNRARGFRTEKALGQNFLYDADILDDLVWLADLENHDDLVLEIGPGIGFLTERLVSEAKFLYAVELDADTERFLKIIQANNKNFKYKRADFLGTKLEDIYQEILDELKAQGESTEKEKVKIVANIPYQISSKIITHLIGDIDQDSANRNLVDEIYILVQKEFAEKLCAEPGTKAYTMLTLFTRYWAEVEYLIDVPREVFHPSPKVDSAFIKIKPRKEPFVKTDEPRKLKRFIKAVFANRRKTLSNGLKAGGYDKEKIEALNLGNLRGETLTMQEMLELVNKLD